MKTTILLRHISVIFALTYACAILSGCTTSSSETAALIPLKGVSASPDVPVPVVHDSAQMTNSLDLAMAYAATDDVGFHIPAVPYKKIKPAYRRQEVDSPFKEKPGTVVVDTANRFLYLVETNGRAMRYGVGIGRQGFSWKGNGVIQWKQTWPHWFPPKEMIARQPELGRFSVANGGMHPGVNNALGARAMYIYRDGKDTLYRLHGTQDWKSIGNAVSSGCVRILNQDVIDLYNRVVPGASLKVI